MDLRNELKQGIIDGYVVPHFQPIVDLRSGDVTGFELLARWNHPAYGSISPGEFIPVAEAEGLMPLLTEALLYRALRSWRDLPAHASVSINISPTQLYGGDLGEMVKAVACEASFPLERLTLEITESALLEEHDEAGRAIAALKEAGCKLALDDFGTGYSSLTYLRKLPFDILKIDQSFVRTMVTCREDRKIVGAVVGLGKSLGLKIVAEGIEDRAQAEMLLCLGCECGQGWFYGRPVPASALTGTGTSRRLKSEASVPRSSSIVCMEAMPAQSFAQLKAIYNAAPVGLGFFDCNFRFVNLNQRMATLHRLAVEDLVGRTLQEIDPLKYALAEPYLIRARSGEMIEDQEFGLPPSMTGMSVTHLASFQPALDEAGEVVGVLLAVTDISERKHVETALKESHDHYVNMVELSPQIPWTMDADGSNLNVSTKWNELTGFPVDQICDRAWLGTVHPEDRSEAAGAIYNAIASGTDIEVEFRLRGTDGLWHWTRARGTPLRDTEGAVVRWYGSLELIEKQRQMRKELEETRANLQQALQTRNTLAPLSNVFAHICDCTKAFWR